MTGFEAVAMMQSRDLMLSWIGRAPETGPRC
jgi:hypothetical protein